MKRFLTQLAWHTGLLAVSVLVILVIRFIDLSFPVIEDFKVTSQSPTANGILIEGSMSKLRDCKILSVSAYDSAGRKLNLDLLEDASLDTRPVRVQLWGPWEVFGKYSNSNNSISLYAEHACSIFWTQTTKLTDLAWMQVPIPEGVTANEAK